MEKKDSGVQICEEIDLFGNSSEEVNSAFTDNVDCGWKTQKKRRKVAKRTKYALLAVFLGLMALGVLVFGVYKWYLWSVENDRINNILKKYAATPGVTVEDRASQGTQYKFLNEDLTQWTKINGDMVAYLNVGVEKINYPVVQCADNEFYLTHDFNKKTNSAGWIFGDAESDFGGGRNIVIYGHNRRDGSMFGMLNHIDDNALANKASRYIQLQTLYGSYVYEIFSVYTTETTFKFNRTQFDSDSDYLTYLKSIESKNTLKSLGNSNLSENDRILTLATCSSGLDDRKVVHAKLVASS